MNHFTIVIVYHILSIEILHGIFAINIIDFKIADLFQFQFRMMLFRRQSKHIQRIWYKLASEPE